MPDPRSLPDDRPNVGTRPLEEEIQALQGEEMPIEQDAVVSLDEIEDEEELSRSEYEAGVPRDPDLRAGETDDPLVAIEEGLTYVPPSDPPIVPSADDRAGVAVPGAEDLDEGESAINARIREALRADGATTELADRLEIAVVGSIAIIRGQVDGLEDGDAIVAVVSEVEGIDDVRDETRLPASRPASRWRRVSASGRGARCRDRSARPGRREDRLGRGTEDLRHEPAHERDTEHAGDEAAEGDQDAARQ